MRLSEVVTTVNKSLLQLRRSPHLEAQLHANNLMKSILLSAEAPDIFGSIFGTASVYRFLRKTSIYCTVESGPNGWFLSRVSMSTLHNDVIRLTQALVQINNAFNQLDFHRLRDMAIHESHISEITKTSFKAIQVNPIQQVLNEALTKINKYNFTVTP